MEKIYRILFDTAFPEKDAVFLCKQWNTDQRLNRWDKRFVIFVTFVSNM